MPFLALKPLEWQKRQAAQQSFFPNLIQNEQQPRATEHANPVKGCSDVTLLPFGYSISLALETLFADGVWEV